MTCSDSRYSPTQLAGALWQEAKTDIGVYGWAVHGYEPARHHQAWLDRVSELVSGTRPLSDSRNGQPESGNTTYRTLRKRKLLLVAPPGHAKSTWLSLILPAWYLGNRPAESLLFFTSSDTMARQFGQTVKQTLGESERHRAVFPAPECRPDTDRGWSTDGLYLGGTPANSKDPSYRALGWGASVIGARAHGIILDDPLTQEQARSPIEQEKARRYHDLTVDSRLHPGGWCVAVMTRWHELDLAQHLADKEDWEVLSMPALGYWREGEALWPERFSVEWLEAKRRDIGGPLFACLYQGNPAALGGAIFKAASWLRPFPEGFTRAKCGRVVQYWDLAYSEKEAADYTVGVTLGRGEAGALYVLGVHRARVTQEELLNVIARQVNLWRPAVVGVEEAAYRQPVTRDLIGRLLRGELPCHFTSVKPTADKVARARLPAGRAEAGLVYADRGAPWFEEFAAELTSFPNGVHDDQVDALSGAVQLALEWVPQPEPVPVRWG